MELPGALEILALPKGVGGSSELPIPISVFFIGPLLIILASFQQRDPWCQDFLVDLTKCSQGNVTFWIYPTETSPQYVHTWHRKCPESVAWSQMPEAKLEASRGQRRHNAGLLLIEWAKWLRFWTCCQKNKWKAVFKLKHLVNTLHLHLIALCGLWSY